MLPSLDGGIQIKTRLVQLVVALAVVATARATFAQALTPEQKAKVEVQLKEIQIWGTAPAVVNAVKAQNTSVTAANADMTQDKWKTLLVLDPVVRDLTKNPAAQFLKSKKTDGVSEAFISDANGSKVAFLAKTTNWNHKGKAKHDDPMAGKTWIGEPETDASTGLLQVQVAAPVLDGDKPIGSLVVGLGISSLQ